MFGALRLYILLSIAATCCATGNSANNVICVAPDGSDTPTCGSVPCCATLKHAVEVVAPPAAAASASPLLIRLAPGLFGVDSCNTTVSTSLTIVGAGVGASVIDCASQARALVVQGPWVNVSLSHLTVQNGYWYEEGAAGGGGCVYVDWTAPEGESFAGSPSFTMASVHVHNCTVASGTALWLVGGGVGVFANGDLTTVGASVIVSNCEFTDNDANSLNGADSIGGGLGYLSNSSALMDRTFVHIVNSSFFSNNALANHTREYPPFWVVDMFHL